VPGRDDAGLAPVLLAASERASVLRHSFVGPEHLLVALAGEGPDPAARVLSSLGLAADTLLARVVEVVGVGRADPPVGPLPLTPRAARVVAAAAVQARDLGSPHVGPEHLLLAVVGEESVAVTVLGRCGVSALRVRREVLTVLLAAE